MPNVITTHLHARNAPQLGVRNMFLNCARAAPGDKVVIAFEPSHFGHFEDALLSDVLRGAEALDLDVILVDVGFAPSQTHLPPELDAHLDQADVVLFLARLGDQLRFNELPKGPKYVVCFAFNSHLIGSPFGTAHYDGFVEIKAAVDARLFTARDITITCPAGTFVQGRVPSRLAMPRDTTSKRFPLSVFSPIPAASFSGEVALCGFLTGTGAQYYKDYTLPFDGQVYAVLQDGRLKGFKGEASDVAKANAQYDRVAALFDLDRDFVHSWHAGIHPGCGFPWDVFANDKRWGGAAFGNPRILHFHTCGAYAPGEISWNVVDPTIDVDGVTLWDKGTLHLERLDEGPSILARYPCVARAFATPDRTIWD